MEHLLYFVKQLHGYAGKILYVNLLGMMLISFLEGMGIFLLLPLLGISGIMDINTGWSSHLGIIELLNELPKSVSLLVIMGAYVVLITGQSLIQRNLSLRDIKIHTGFISHVRLETYNALLHANWGFFIKKRKSDLINSLTGELGHVTTGSYVFLQFMTSMIFTLIQVGIALWLSVKLTLFVIGCGLAVSFFSRTFIKRASKVGNQSLEIGRNYIGGITDHFNGIKDIKSNMLEESRRNWLIDWSKQFARERFEAAKISANSQLYYKVSSSLIIAVFIYASVMLFHTQGQQLMLIILVFFRLWPRFQGIQTNLEQIATAIPAFKSLKELQNACRASREVKEESRGNNHVKPIHIEEYLECRDVSFRYNRNEEVCSLQDINLRIRSNQMTAVVGRSGAGKSTLIDILMGMLQPEKGQVLVDGVPLTGTNLLSLRKSISYVPQDPFLFNGSIRENLLMIDPDATEVQIWDALEFAASAEFVRKLPQGLDTLIGDRGIRLSGGERQRLVLARAILRKPSILILDEATSSLDTENEAKIQEALDRLQGKLTIIVIAHRLSTIRNADQVIVMDQGRIVQSGEFIQLAREKDGLFSTFLSNQFADSKAMAAT
ncbi:ABC transporter ATP-binding protein [Paenibacillus planticolens]|uniref:ATP-binding cassette domain-containing protein n=1 Tax=Paenibacillus planticolens TaxID=2654976 RepID=A0ABX1ZMW0_9BACL|nr:ABC transporter ATP-binding protein [Paenibacillus planticolens]NOV00217.1 ATP-binding cassette domain-containing protein [Paenibacillus planticolens]